MYHFRTNPPARGVPPRPALKPSQGYATRTLSATTILDRIERHLKHTGLAPSAFGRRVVGDPNLVFALRAGAEPRKPMLRKIEAALDAEGDNA